MRSLIHSRGTKHNIYLQCDDDVCACATDGSGSGGNDDGSSHQYKIKLTTTVHYYNKVRCFLKNKIYETYICIHVYIIMTCIVYGTLYTLLLQYYYYILSVAR